MKALKIAGAILFGLIVYLGLGALTAAADGPVAYLDNQSHTISADGSVLYRFDYAINNDTGEHPITNITLVNGSHSGLGFQVWTLDNVKLAQRPDATSTMDNVPVGRGTPQTVDCDTGEITASGACQSPDLTWSGALGATGTYYVLVSNANSSPASFLLKIQGSGVSLGQQLASAQPGPAAAPAHPPRVTDDPAKAAAITGQPLSVPVNFAIWYRFDYAVNHDTGERPMKLVRLLSVKSNGLRFQVYSPEILNDWWDNTPIGKGNPEMVLCEDGSSGCQSDNLIWSGTFGADGTYYVRVINDSANAAAAVLTIQ